MAAGMSGAAGRRRAMLWEKGEEGKLVCLLCSHRCKLGEGKEGICRVRRAEGGELVTLVYAQAAALHVDPIEKKPFFHFLPGSRSLSVATVGCNFRCAFCQNWSLSQAEEARARAEAVTPEELVALAERQGCLSISYTYSEPTVFFEYTFDTAKLARARGIRNNYVTNGYMSPEMLDAFHPNLDAANVDLKAFDEATYRKVMGGNLAPVLDSIRKMRELGIWVEVTTLLVPGMNDSEGELRSIARFLSGLDPGIPWHVSAFHPDYRMEDRPPTSIASLRRAREIGLGEGLRWVYTGNVAGDRGENTACPACGAMLVERIGFSVRANRIAGGKCPGCGAAVDGVWS